MDGSTIEHLLDVFPHLLYQWWSDALELFLKWLNLSQLDDMLGGISASHFILVKGEDAMMFHEQPSGSLGIFLWPVFKHREVSILLQDFISSGDALALGTKLTVTTHLTSHPPDKHIGWEVPFLRTRYTDQLLSFISQ